jgi:two-component system OmpR family response regulator
MKSLRQEVRPFPVVILSALAAPSDRIAGLEAGADDYLSKPFHFRELQLRVERLLHSPSASASPPQQLPHQPNSFLIGTMRFTAEPEQRLLTASGESFRLTRGEGALLGAFCRNPGVVLSRAQLLQSTGSLVSSGHSRTIDVRLSRLRKLLRQLTGGELIDPVRGQGYRLVGNVVPCLDDEPLSEV